MNYYLRKQKSCSIMIETAFFIKGLIIYDKPIQIV